MARKPAAEQSPKQQPTGKAPAQPAATQPAAEEYIFLPQTMSLPYEWTAGKFVGRFLEELRDNARIYANKCPKCGRHLVPPRIVCPTCHTEMGDWVDLGTVATVLTYTVMVEPFRDPQTGKIRQGPWTFGCIQFDKAPAVMRHLLEETDEAKLSVGMKVKAVFKPRNERTGFLTDILHFSTI